MSEPKVGSWVVHCCCLDAFQIDTQENLEHWKGVKMENERDVEFANTSHFFDSWQELLDAGFCSCDEKCSEPV